MKEPVVVSAPAAGTAAAAMVTETMALPRVVVLKVVLSVAAAQGAAVMVVAAMVPEALVTVGVVGLVRERAVGEHHCSSLCSRSLARPIGRSRSKASPRGRCCQGTHLSSLMAVTVVVGAPAASSVTPVRTHCHSMHYYMGQK